jgi:7-cyano-7-deazaguanine synthase
MSIDKGSTKMEKAVILLSGGLDSCTCMAIAKDKGYELYPISFNYHQRHRIELDGAKKIAAFYGVKRHLIIETNLDDIGGSALTDSSIEVPEGDTHRTEIPDTYVPARNLIFLSYAMGYAEVLGASHVFIGVNSVDYSGYPDCRPEFIKRFQDLADYATTATAVRGKKIKIETPLQYLSKADIVRKGMELGAPYQFTHSCYKGGEKACGVCDSCKLRLEGFREAGYEDPIEYETRPI